MIILPTDSGTKYINSNIYKGFKMRSLMAIFILTILASFSTPAADLVACGKVQEVTGDSCDSLKVTLDLSTCGESKDPIAAKVSCGNNEIVGLFRSETANYRAIFEKKNLEGDKTSFAIKGKVWKHVRGESGQKKEAKIDAPPLKVPVVIEPALPSTPIALAPIEASKPTFEPAKPSVEPPKTAKIQKPKDEDLNRLVELFSGITLKGSVDGYYLYNSNNPAVNTIIPTAADSKSQNKYRVFDLYHDDLQISYAHLQIQKTISQLSTTLDFGYGPAMQVLSGTKTDAAQINMNQAFVGYKPFESLKIEAGRFYTHIGFEVPETQDDWNYSRSLLSGYFQPAWHQGVKATFSKNDKLLFMVIVADGWNNSYVNSRQKSYGSQINWNPTDSFSFFLNTMGGTNALPRNLDNNNTVQNRNLYDFVASYKVNDKLSFAINSDSYVHGIYSATGTAVYSKYQFNEKWTVSPRYELADDKDNLIFGESFTDGQKLSSLTLTIENRINANLILRLEGRQDNSNRETFQKDGTGVNSQSTGTLGFVASF